MEEKTIWEKLMDLGFKKKLVPIKTWQVWVNRILGKRVYVAKELDYDLINLTTDGDFVEVYACDIWYIQMKVGNKVVFDERRFVDEELLSLVPHNLQVTN